MDKFKTFASTGLSNGLLKIVAELGFVQMTPIQAASIPAILAGKDLIGQSKTGSGKTAAFVLPLLQSVDSSQRLAQALILCPTRELCAQVFRECQIFAKGTAGVKVVELSGGQAQAPQTEALRNGAQVIVGTPGRTLENLRSGVLKLRALRTIVLDEADRLLEEGFADEMKAIFEFLPEKRQTIFFSATYPEQLADLTRTFQKNPERITIAGETESAPAIEQFLYEAEKPEKVQTLLQILRAHPSKCTLIFCRTKALVAEIGKILVRDRYDAHILHADLKQTERDRTMKNFRQGKIGILVATDLAARGLDIDHLELVINVDLPPSPDIYIHRIGRTGRAGRNGTAVSIATDYEKDLVKLIEATTMVPMVSMVRRAPGS